MHKTFLIVLFTVFSFGTSLLAREYHVSVHGKDTNAGSFTAPFRTISAAVKVAMSGDIITVHEGTYRERINPIRGGKSASQRIVFRAAPNEKVAIKGSEIISGWKKEKSSEGVWKVTIPNTFFGKYNPFKDKIAGDWFFDLGRVHHTGEVF